MLKNQKSTIKMNKTSEVTDEVYDGSRGEDFRHLIHSTLQKGKMIPKYIEMLMDERGMRTFDEAFTAASKSVCKNYEMLEQLGDVLANAAIKWYMTRRFPMIRCPEGVETGARLLIKYGAKQSFSTIAERLGFWPFISSSVDQRNRNKKKLLEDVFEAFLGAVAEITEERTRHGVGYGIVYDIIESVFDDMDISLREEDLVDSKSRLKETFDANRSQGEVIYLSDKQEIVSYDGKQTYITVSTAYQLRPENQSARHIFEELDSDCTRNIAKYKNSIAELSNDESVQETHDHIVTKEKLENKINEQLQIRQTAIENYKKKLIWLGEGKASIKKDAEKKAASQGLETMKKRGYSKKTKVAFKDAPGQQKKYNS